MVAAAKLKRSQDRILAARPYAHKMRGVLGNLSQRVNRFAHPLLQKREGRKIEVLVVTSDRGLCGGVNGNIVRKSLGISSASERRGLHVDSQHRRPEGPRLFSPPIMGDQAGMDRGVRQIEF